jgi:hypothetical protein
LAALPVIDGVDELYVRNSSEPLHDTGANNMDQRQPRSRLKALSDEDLMSKAMRLAAKRNLKNGKYSMPLLSLPSRFF